MNTSNARFWQMDSRYMQFMQLRAAGLNPDTLDDYLTNSVAEWLNVDAKPLEYTEDGIAIVAICGPLYKRKSPFESNYRSIGEALDALLLDPPRAVVLKIDSPGGMVDGLGPIVDKVEQLAALTLVVAHGDGSLLSAAYRIAAAAGTIVVCDDCDTGSIGTFFQLMDYSKAFADNGLKSVMLTTGPFKGLGAAGEPINDEQRAFLQEYVDRLNGDFLNDVQAGRGFTAEQITAVSDGRFWGADDALALGLIDRIGSFADVLQAIRSQQTGQPTMAKATLAPAAAAAAAETGKPSQAAEAAAETPNTGDAGGVPSTPLAGAAPAAAAAKSLADYMQQFGDAEGAKMFRDGVTWDAAQSQHSATIAKQLEEARGALQDKAAENAQLQSRVAELAKAVGGESSGLNIGTGDTVKKKSFGDACRAAAPKRS